MENQPNCLPFELFFAKDEQSAIAYLEICDLDTLLSILGVFKNRITFDFDVPYILIKNSILSRLSTLSISNLAKLMPKAENHVVKSIIERDTFTSEELEIFADLKLKRGNHAKLLAYLADKKMTVLCEKIYLKERYAGRELLVKLSQLHDITTKGFRRLLLDQKANVEGTSWACTSFEKERDALRMIVSNAQKSIDAHKIRKLIAECNEIANEPRMAVAERRHNERLVRRTVPVEKCAEPNPEKPPIAVFDPDVLELVQKQLKNFTPFEQAIRLTPAEFVEVYRVSPSLNYCLEDRIKRGDYTEDELIKIYQLTLVIDGRPYNVCCGSLYDALVKRFRFLGEEERALKSLRIDDCTPEKLFSAKVPAELHDCLKHRALGYLKNMSVKDVSELSQRYPETWAGRLLSWFYEKALMLYPPKELKNLQNSEDPRLKQAASDELIRRKHMRMFYIIDFTVHDIMLLSGQTMPDFIGKSRQYSRRASIQKVSRNSGDDFHITLILDDGEIIKNIMLTPETMDRLRVRTDGEPLNRPVDIICDQVTRKIIGLIPLLD